jgi:hypothetical protein
MGEKLRRLGMSDDLHIFPEECPLSADSTPDKSSLERKKLHLENANLKNFFIRFAAVGQACATVIIAAIGLFYTWRSGGFDVQSKLLEDRKALLEYQTTKLEDQKKATQMEIDKVSAGMASATQTLSNLIHVVFQVKIASGNPEVLSNEVHRLIIKFSKEVSIIHRALGPPGRILVDSETGELLTDTETGEIMSVGPTESTQ